MNGYTDAILRNLIIEEWSYPNLPFSLEIFMAKLESQAILDALGHGVLIFSSDGKLDQHNITAATILGTDLNVIKTEGWSMAAELFDTGLQAMDMRLDTV